MDLIKRPYNKLSYVPFYKVQINDDFWSKRQKINRDVSIHLQHEKLEQDHHIDNFRVAGGVKKGVQIGEFYYDSDLYKWLEATSYILHTHSDPDLELKANEIVDLINKSQIEDGYVNTFYSTRFLQERFTNLYIMHELYCAGHLIQAAVAHNIATGKETLLNVAIKFADLLVKTFLGGKRKGVPGHEEIELALIELYRLTNKSNYLELAKEFINRRGKISNFKTYVLNQYLNMRYITKLAKKKNLEFEKEVEGKNISSMQKSEVAEFVSGFTIKDFIKFIRENLNGNFIQSNRPVRDISEPVGHAVRAMYLYCGMADLYSETGEEALLKSLRRIWLKMDKARMYITGGIGSERSTEGFGKDFALGNRDSYSETCAAIGNVMWNWRMIQITGNCKYAELVEKLLYNAMLVGQSIDGTKYTYNNPLISHGKDERKEWFLCACCPPNVARIISSLGQYIYSTSEKGIWVHQYIGNTTNFNFQSNLIKISQKSQFPWKGKVEIHLNLSKNQKFSIFLRIPNWSIAAELTVNGIKHSDGLSKGKYVEILRNWLDNDIILLTFKMKANLIKSDPRIKDNRGRAAISYGPLIFCLEQKDNKKLDIFKNIIPRNQEFIVKYKPELLGGINIITGKNSNNEIFTAIPYFAWSNRGPDKMQIWHKSI